MGAAANIGEIAKLKGIPLKEVSRRADIPYTTLYNAVKRDSKIELRTVQKAADALGVSLINFYSQDELKEIKEDLYRQQQIDQKQIAQAFREQHQIEMAKKQQEQLFAFVLRYIQDCFGQNGVKLLQSYNKLNSNGQSVAVERVQELAQIPAYQRPAEDAQTAPTVPDDKEPAKK